MTAWREMTAAALGRGIGAGTICPVALAEAFLAANEADPNADRIYARTMPRQALDTAMGARARAKAGLRRGPLDGVPVAWKDLFDTAGVATEAGSALLAGRVPVRDATVVARLTAAGMPPLGKVHMTELAFSGLGLNPVTASPPNVNDPGAVSGGSSSGSAAAVAFGLAPLAIGSDTGGSVRLPAAWNDLVGLKTTAGRIPLDGVVPLAARFDTVGPLARTVEDAALAFAALDGTAAPDLRGARLAGARLMVLETVALDDLDAPVAEAFEGALGRLQDAGAQLLRGAIPEVAEAMGLAGILYTAECWGTWGARIEAAPDLMYPPVRERFRSGAAHLAADYVAAWHRLDTLRLRIAAAVAGFDAVVMPTAAGLPPKAAPLLADAGAFAAANLRALRNTRIGNLTGGCALTLPTGRPSVGISLMAGPGDEARLLRLGAAAEAALAR
jgi:aspartyl-tRNA(Asn)/glutamyl-tRNA(Gln) amidotransferase subunit A